MSTSDILAVAALLLSVVVSLKTIMARNGNRPVKAHDLARLIERLEQLERKADQVNAIHEAFEKLAVKIEYDVLPRLKGVENEVFRQEMLEQLQRKFPRKEDAG